MPPKKVILFRVKALFVFLFLSPSSAALAPASDTPYLKTSLTDNLEVIFSEDFKEEDFLIQNRAFRIFREYGRQFPVKFYRKNSLIFISATRRQTPLAITHTLPLPLIQIYPSPFQIMDKVSTNNWLTDSLIHEMAHIHQLSSRTWFSYLLSFIMPSYLWPVYPNIYFHDLILEGHAVLLESIYGTGGRLFSGWERALVFSQLKNNLSLSRIVNHHDDPFSKEEKFTHGGYFFSYLIKKFPLSKLHSIFSANGRNIIWPFGIYTMNRSFKTALNQDFESLFNEYKEFYGAMAFNQSSSPEPALITSRISVPINSNEKNIFFMISEGKRPPQLILMNKETGELFSKTVNMPLGKIFFIEGDYYSAGYGRTDTLSVKMSLFRDGFIPLKKYNSSYVMDVQGDDILSFDAMGGLDQYHLYLNEELLAGARSTAIRDTQGRAWYFKQKGEERTLYRDKTPLWTYKGYYGFPVEANESEVYFLAPTPYGSGLFVYNDKGVFRLSPSDTIVSARQIDKDRFLVCEVNNHLFEYKIIPVKPFSDQPVLYEYDFHKTDLEGKWASSHTSSPTTLLEDDSEESEVSSRDSQKLSQEIRSEGNIPYEEEGISTEQEQDSPILQQNKKWSASPYHSIFNLRLQEVALGWNFRDIFQTRNFHPEKWPFHYRLILTDPLEYSFLSTQGKLSPQSRLFLTEYEYRRYRPAWRLSYQNGWGLKKSTSIHSHYFLTGLRYPLIRKEDWSFSISANAALKTIQKKQEPLHPFIIHELRLNFNFNKHYPLALYAYGKLDFSLRYNNEYDIKKRVFHPSYGFQWSTENELAQSFYVFTEGEWWKNKRNAYLISSALLPGRKPALLSFHSLSGGINESQKTTDFLSASIYFKKVINQSVYPVYFPLALRRWAPFIGFSSLFSLNPDTRLSSHRKNTVRQKQASALTSSSSIESFWSSYKFFYPFLGGEMELLANHKALAYLGFSGGLLWKNSEKEKPLPTFQWGVYLKAQF